MTSQRPDVDATGRYSIKETSALLGIHRNTLRRYTAKGLIKSGFRKCTKSRFYTGLEILRVWNQTI